MTWYGFARQVIPVSCQVVANQLTTCKANSYCRRSSPALTIKERIAQLGWCPHFDRRRIDAVRFDKLWPKARLKYGESNSSSTTCAISDDVVAVVVVVSGDVFICVVSVSDNLSLSVEWALDVLLRFLIKWLLLSFLLILFLLVFLILSLFLFTL